MLPDRYVDMPTYAKPDWLVDERTRRLRAEDRAEQERRESARARSEEEKRASAMALAAREHERAIGRRAIDEAIADPHTRAILKRRIEKADAEDDAKVAAASARAARSVESSVRAHPYVAAASAHRSSDRYWEWRSGVHHPDIDAAEHALAAVLASVRASLAAPH